MRAKQYENYSRLFKFVQLYMSHFMRGCLIATLNYSIKGLQFIMSTDFIPIHGVTMHNFMQKFINKKIIKILLMHFNKKKTKEITHVLKGPMIIQRFYGNPFTSSTVVPTSMINDEGSSRDVSSPLFSHYKFP